MKQLELKIMKALGFAVTCARTWQSFFSLPLGRHAVADGIRGGYSTSSNTKRRQETNQEKTGRVFIAFQGFFRSNRNTFK